MSFLKVHGHYAGYKINIAKTQVLTFNYSLSHQIQNTYNFNWNCETMKYLGITITKRLDKLYEASDNVIEQNIKDIQTWSISP